MTAAAAAADTITYTIHNHDLSDPIRRIELNGCTPDDVRRLVEDGYVVRERLVQGELLERLRTAADEVAQQQGGEGAVGTGKRFGGLFVRDLIDRHPVFLEVLLKFAPTLSLARAVLGPQVQIHATVLRVTYPGQPNQETHWHWHQRVIPEPLPPLFGTPHVVDNLIYLDDTDEATGGLAVLPGTHKQLFADLPADDYSEKPGQVVLNMPAGSCVTADAALWHRGLPTLPHGRVRRLLILGYSPSWMKQVDRPGDSVPDALTRALLASNPDTETRELLGRAGYY
jgi:ectoine hydroxylase-related dioxygenase (phytanoyl-CoA dioxygenase family)